MVERVKICKEATDANVEQDILANIARSVGVLKYWFIIYVVLFFLEYVHGVIEKAAK